MLQRHQHNGSPMHRMKKDSRFNVERLGRLRVLVKPGVIALILFCGYVTMVVSADLNPWQDGFRESLDATRGMLMVVFQCGHAE